MRMLGVSMCIFVVTGLMLLSRSHVVSCRFRVVLRCFFVRFVCHDVPLGEPELPSHRTMPTAPWYTPATVN